MQIIQEVEEMRSAVEEKRKQYRVIYELLYEIHTEEVMKNASLSEEGR